MPEHEDFHLRNVDPDDISDVLVKIEKSFGFKFDQKELLQVETFGELCEIITNKVQSGISIDCTSQQSFYKLRDALSITLNIDKRYITPSTDLERLRSYLFQSLVWRIIT